MPNTPTIDLEQPTVGGSDDLWGASLNSNADKIDAVVKDKLPRLLDSGSGSYANLDIALPDDYRAWTIVLSGLYPTAGAQTLLRVSDDDASSYLSGTSYRYAGVYSRSDSPSADLRSNAAASIPLLPSTVVNATYASRIEIEITSIDGKMPVIEVKGTNYDGNGIGRYIISGSVNTTNKLTHIRIFPGVNVGAWALYSRPGL